MFKIEPIEEVVTKRKLVIEIDEDEIARILVDPRHFQKALRQEKSKWNGGRQVWSLNGHGPARAKRAAKKTTEKKIGEGPRSEVPQVSQGFQGTGPSLGELYGQQRPLSLGACAIAARRIG